MPHAISPRVPVMEGVFPYNDRFVAKPGVTEFGSVSGGVFTTEADAIQWCNAQEDRSRRDHS